MRLLLDTHALLWALENPSLLRAETRTAIERARTPVLVSAASAWEIGIKIAVGKLRAPLDLMQQLRDKRFTPLPVTVEHGLRVGELPLLHKDPFDRLLVAQAQLEGLTIVTRDPRIAAYDVETLAA
ncbi:MAG: type II toxin-antitoxin system VapC family toxin [Actinomycetota bacterium]|nr:type II toxin-antitoxin system VapC family toxin [Actinomycetota bacterium]MBA3566685.1 type II toxin-antitoxin system VapC family toxin [Actinomycetota bacterium]MDQ3085507.1 type II toxin-antitoxin system VapC family toxin [Actinomycetota bacterium]MDQ3425976.1 type II toxin-antitoxin system VapC family toxin [Actinomycetota bacterium]